MAWNLARRVEPHNALGWGLQTALLGYPSLTLLKKRSSSKRSTR